MPPSDLSSKMALPIEMPVGDSGESIESLFPSRPFKKGSRSREKKALPKIESDEYLDEVLKNFSGNIAVDEVYDGRCCILSLVDNHTSKRLMFRVLEKSPVAEDIVELLQSFRTILDQRELQLYGITTDGSALYTEPVRTVFSGVRHQICEFHVKKEVNKSVLKAVTHVCRELDKKKTRRSKRGRPTKQEKALVRKNERIQKKIGALFEHRYLFVQKELTAKEQKTFLAITRGMPELRTLREIADLVYRLYDRRCCRQYWIAVWYFWMTSICPRRAMRWSVAIDDFARCRRRCIVFGLLFIFGGGRRWICFGTCIYRYAVKQFCLCTRQEQYKNTTRSLLSRF